jgi:hypothetical protein
MNYTLNDRAIDFELGSQLNFTLGNEPIEFIINATLDIQAEGFRLLEDGFYRLLEDGELRLLE